MQLRHYWLGYIDQLGAVKIQPQFDEVTDFSKGSAHVRIGDRWGMIDKAGKWVVKLGKGKEPE